MCAVCVQLGWDRDPRQPVQLELQLLDENGQPLECAYGHPTERTGRGYRWCPACRAAVWIPDLAEGQAVPPFPPAPLPGAC